MEILYVFSSIKSLKLILPSIGSVVDLSDYQPRNSLRSQRSNFPT